MVELSIEIILELFIKVCIGTFLTISAFLVLRRVRFSKGACSLLDRMRVSRIVVLLIIFWILTFAALLVWLKAATSREFSNIYDALEHGTRLKVSNSVMALEGDIVKDWEVEDKNAMKDVCSLMREASYTRIPSGGAIATKEAIHLYIFSNGRQTCAFSVIADILITSGNCWYLCSGKDLLLGLRETLAVEGKSQ